MRTGFYYKANNIELSKLVCISRTAPEWFPQDQCVFSLMPSWYLLNSFKNEKISEKQYCDLYRLQLSRLNAEDLYKSLTEKYGEDCVLLCWCGVNDFCHRHLVAEWFENELGVKIKELGKTEYERKDGRLIKINMQGSLF